MPQDYRCEMQSREQRLSPGESHFEPVLEQRQVKKCYGCKCSFTSLQTVVLEEESVLLCQRVSDLGITLTSTTTTSRQPPIQPNSTSCYFPIRYPPLTLLPQTIPPLSRLSSPLPGSVLFKDFPPFARVSPLPGPLSLLGPPSSRPGPHLPLVKCSPIPP